MRAIRRAGVPLHQGASDLALEGGEAVEAIRFTARGRASRIPARVVLLHQGVVPNTQISWSAARAAVAGTTRNCAGVPVTDEWGELDVAGIYVAGDGRGIGGAQAAEQQGRLAALEVAHRAGRIDRPRATRSPRRAARVARDAAYPAVSRRAVSPEGREPRPGRRRHRVPVREVTAGELRGFVRLGCLGPNQAKSFGRCGMGPCQGRLCGLTVTEVIASERGVSPAEVGYYRVRPPIKPVTLAELAAAHEARTRARRRRKPSKPARPRRTMNATGEGADVIVIGGGLHGLSSALHLARRGARVIRARERRVRTACVGRERGRRAHARPSRRRDRTFARITRRVV